MNNWNFIGFLGKNAEVRFTTGGMAVCSFPVAVKSGYSDKEKTTWVICTLFGKRAEGKLPEYLIKGAQVAISGESFLDEWEDKEGLKRSTLKVNVNSLDLIGGRAEATNAQGDTGAHHGASSSPTPQAAPEQFDDGLDIPF